MKNNLFKFRAECFRDIREFINLLPNHQCISLTVKPLYVSFEGGTKIIDGQEVTIETGGYGVKELLDIMSKITDSHVMMETLAQKEKYTGERNDSIYDTLTT